MLALRHGGDAGTYDFSDKGGGVEHQAQQHGHKLRAERCAAFDLHVSLSVLLLTYTAGMAAAGLTPLPAGVGAVETAMTLGLTLGGATASAALGVVLLYRLISVGSTVAVGWIVVALQPHHHHTGVEPIGSQL